MKLAEHVATELIAAQSLESQGAFEDAFRHLERAHILGQSSTRLHVLTHIRMLGWAWRRGDWRELRGQIFRIFGAATKTAIGLVPTGNSGGSNVSPFKAMEVPDDLAKILAQRN